MKKTIMLILLMSLFGCQSIDLERIIDQQMQKESGYPSLSLNGEEFDSKQDKKNMLCLIANLKETQKIILEKAKLCSKKENHDFFSLLYSLSYESETMLPNDIVRIFPFLKKKITESINLLNQKGNDKLTDDENEILLSTAIFLLLCGDNAVPFLEKNIKDNADSNERIKKVLKILIKIEDIQKGEVSLAYVMKDFYRNF